WVGLAGAPKIVSLDTTTHAVDGAFVTGFDERKGEIYPGDLHTMPGSLTSVGVATRFLWTDARGFDIYDSGTPRYHPANLDRLLLKSDVSTFQFSGPDRVYAAGNGYFVTLDLGATAMTLDSSISDLIPTIPAQIRYAGGKVFDGLGRIVDPVTGTLV